jgi:broad specificity phosphatase PhoE
MKRSQAWLVRHGESAMAVEQRLSGHNSSPLTDAGRGHARTALSTIRALSAREPLADTAPVRVVSSPITRARQTAEIISEGLDLPLTLRQDLAETDFGDWDGLTAAEMTARWPDLFGRWCKDKSVRPPRGETYAETATRVCAALREITAAPDEVVIIVSHSNPIKATAALALCQAEDRVLDNAHLDFGATSRFEVAEAADWTMLSWNEIYP